MTSSHSEGTEHLYLDATARELLDVTAQLINMLKQDEYLEGDEWYPDPKAEDSEEAEQSEQSKQSEQSVKSEESEESQTE